MVSVHAILSAGTGAGRRAVYSTIKDVRKRWVYNRCCWHQLPLSRNFCGQTWNISISERGEKRRGQDMTETSHTVG